MKYAIVAKKILNFNAKSYLLKLDVELKMGFILYKRCDIITSGSK